MKEVSSKHDRVDWSINCMDPSSGYEHTLTLLQLQLVTFINHVTCNEDLFKNIFTSTSHQKCYQGRFLIERTASSIFHRETNFQAWDGLRRNVFHLENQNNYCLSDYLDFVYLSSSDTTLKFHQNQCENLCKNSSYSLCNIFEPIHKTTLILLTLNL